MGRIPIIININKNKMKKLLLTLIACVALFATSCTNKTTTSNESTNIDSTFVASDTILDTILDSVPSDTLVVQ